MFHGSLTLDNVYICLHACVYLYSYLSLSVGLREVEWERRTVYIFSLINGCICHTYYDIVDTQTQATEYSLMDGYCTNTLKFYFNSF